jgi:3-hydroxybutyryl-CoA dehydrogenase
MKNVAVIGAGTMGNGIAHVFAQFGYTTTLIDLSEASLLKAVETITKNLDRQVSKGLLSAEEKESTLKNLSTSTQM